MLNKTKARPAEAQWQCEARATSSVEHADPDKSAVSTLDSLLGLDYDTNSNGEHDGREADDHNQNGQK